MRSLNILAAVSGAFALAMLALGAHALRLEPADIERVRLGGLIQAIAAAAALAVANRAGRLNVVAGAMILGGAALFSGALYALAITHVRAIAALAPIGGATLIGGWIVLAFAHPRAGPRKT